MIKELEEKEDQIVDKILTKILIVKEVTAIKDQEVKESTMTVINHQVDTMDKMKEEQDVEPEVVQELTTTIKIDQEEEELKVVTTMKVEPEEESEVLDHKLLLTDQPEVDLVEELQEAMVLVEELQEAMVLVEELQEAMVLVDSLQEVMVLAEEEP